MAKKKNSNNDISIAPGIRRRGNSLQLDFYYERVRCREALALDPNIRGNIEFAKKKLAAIKYEIAINRFNYLDHFPNSSRAAVFGHNTVTDMTVGDLLDWYVKQKKGGWKKETLDAYNGYIKCHIKPGIGKIMAKNLRPSKVNEWLSSATATNKRKNNWLILIRGAYKAAKVNGLLEKNYMEDFPNLKIDKTEPDPFDADQVDTILSSFDQPEARYYYEIGFWSGLIPSERRGLKWVDIDFSENSIHIRRARVRNIITSLKNTHRWRTIDMLPPVREALLRLQELNGDNEWVCINPNTGKVWNEQTIRKRWVKALNIAGIKYKRGYTTRHTYASLMLSLGIPLSWLKMQMGHTNYRMLEEIYARWTKISHEKRRKMLDWFLEISKHGHIPDELTHFIKQIQ